jgi:hypothetical protein
MNFIDWFISWFEVYRQHFLFNIHLIIFIVFILNVLSSFYKYFIHHKKKLKEDPSRAEYYVDNIDRFYHLIAEIFLLTGLAGTALVFQAVLQDGKLDTEQILKLRGGIAFSAAGIMLSVITFLCRSLLVKFYQKYLEETAIKRFSCDNDQIKELSAIKNLLSEYIAINKNPHVPERALIDELKNLNQTFKSAQIQEQFASELNKVIQRWQDVSKEQLTTINEGVIKATDMLSAVKKFIDDQYEQSNKFLTKLDELALRLTQTETNININTQTLITDIAHVRNTFLDDIRKITIGFTETSQKILTTLHTSQQLFQDNFLSKSSDYIDRSTHLLKNALDKAFDRTAVILKESVRETMNILHQTLYHDLKNEHEEYILKIQRYQNLLEKVEEKGEIRTKEAAKVLISYHKQLLDLNEARNTNYLESVNKEVQNLFATFDSKTQSLNQSLDTYNETIIKSTTEFRRLVQIISESHKSMMQALSLSKQMIDQEREALNKKKG